MMKYKRECGNTLLKMQGGDKKMKCTLKVLNKNDWLQHASKIIEERGTKSDEELLKEIVKFNYKFDTIQDEPQVSSTVPQSP